LNRFSGSQANLGLLCCLASFFLILGIASGEVHSFDIFWQLQSGKYIWQTKAFLYRDTFTLAWDVFRYEHCWLHDLIFYAAHYLGGYSAVSLLKGALVAGLTGLCFAVARLRKVAWSTIFLATPSLILMTFWGWKERPQLWSYLGLVLLVLLFERNRLKKNNFPWLILVALILWANLHAGYILVFPILLAYLVGELIDLWRKSPWALNWKGYRQLILTALMAPIAAMLTPYGWRPVQALLASSPKMGEASGAIELIYNVDWLGTTFDRYPLYYYLAGFVAIILLLSWRRLRAADFLLLAGLAYMGTKLERHTPFFMLAAAALLPFYLDTLIEGVREKLGRPRPALVLAPVLILGVIATGYWSKTPLKNYGFFETGLRQWQYPVAEAEFVRQHQPPGNIFNTYGAGGYLMWTLFPDYKVFWDGRQDSNQFFQLGLKVIAARESWEEILAEHEVNTLILEACSQVDGRRLALLEKLRGHREWTPVFAAETHLVFVREGTMPDAWMTKYALPDSVIDDTILAEALQLLQVTPLRKQALWEVAKVLLERGDMKGAFPYLKSYIAVVGSNNVSPQVLNYYQWLSRTLSK